MKAAILTLSDKGARGERVDESGPALSAWLKGHGVDITESCVIADDHDQIVTLLRDWADCAVADLIITTGGTGVSPRDVTPEATMAVVEKTIPGLSELMRLRSLEKTPMASLSRAIAGIRKRCLILNLPGSPRGALENLQAVWPALGHAIEKIQGGDEDCGGHYEKQTG